MNPAVTHVLQFFEYHHLPPHLQAVSEPFAKLAHQIASASSNPETTVALRKLLESKDAAVRAVLAEKKAPREAAATPAPKPAWRPFVLDCNSYGFTSLGIDSPEAWVEYVRRAKQIHKDMPGTPSSRLDGTVLGFLLEAKASPRSLEESASSSEPGVMPSFGYYSEHRSKVSLESWAQSQGMDLRQIYVQGGSA